METIRVNMTPCEDIKTIHASQNDNEAREWGFELHNNGEKIDSSSISDQMVFKAYKGGTEQILPENGSTPTTSPFKGDIRYPQGLLSDQEFLYRESPTEEDGKANIKSLYGNTIVWNQLCNGIATSTADGITTEYDSSTHKYKITNNSRATNYSSGSTRGVFTGLQNTENNHKYLLYMTPQIYGVSFFCVTDGSAGNLFNGNRVIWQSAGQSVQLRITNEYDFVNAHPIGDVIEFNVLVIDLTRMFGSGNEPATVEEFTSLFGNLLYDYNAGTLLSFNGTGLKTVGKNLLDANIGIAYGGGSGMRWYDSQGFMLMANKTYTFSASNTGGASVAVYIIDHATRNSLASSSLVTTYTPTQNVIVYLQAYRGSGIPSETEFQLEFGSQTAYEPYTESVINLPISTYFPNGMDGVGSEYDELTNTKAYHRMARVDLGTLNWSYNANYGFISTSLSGVIKGEETYSAIGDIACAKYTTNAYSAVTGGQTDKCIAVSPTQYGYVVVSDSVYTDAQTFKTSLSGVYLVYPLANPTETSFTTASLVTENAEIPLSNEDGTLIGKCTEELSENPGFFDAKIKLSDSDGDVYSNKIQLHIERSPQ